MWRSQRPIVEGMEMRTFGEEEGRLRWVCQTCNRFSTKLRLDRRWRRWSGVASSRATIHQCPTRRDERTFLPPRVARRRST